MADRALLTELSFFLHDETETVSLGQCIGATLTEDCVVHLAGTLGAGKTTLTRGLLQSLGHQGAVKSPTYTLVEPYSLQGRDVYHFDLYRLADPEELEYMGIRDYFAPGAVCIIEWPDKGRGYLPLPDLAIELYPEEKGRRALISALSEKGKVAVTDLATQSMG